MNSSIIHNDDSISTRLFAKWISDRYSFSLDKFTKIQEEVAQIIINDTKYKKVVTLEGNYKNHLVFNDEAMIVLTQKSVEDEMEEIATFFEVFAKDIDTFDEYYSSIIELNKSTNKDKVVVEYHSFSPSSFESIADSVEFLNKDLFLSVNSDVYEPYLDVSLLFDTFLSSKSPVLQLTGKPGLGKSKLITLFIKHLLSKPECLQDGHNLKIARPASSEVLAKEEFWVSLRQGKFQALILDDIDYILQERNETISSSEDKMHNDIVNKMLTFTDGLLHQNTKILITTNVTYSKIDKALSRDFRLFDSLELRALTYEEALEIWQKRFELSDDDFENIFEDQQDITPARLSQEAEKFIKKEDDSFARQATYCKEANISKLEKIRNTPSRKVGFGS